MKRLCIIPARGGSERLPDKNICGLADKPLVYHGKIRGYYMPRERSVDIDTELDLKIAEALLNEH